MGRKRKKTGDKPFCYYCGRGFPDEKVLIQHQKARHFKCEKCHKKMATAHALLNHMYQVHKETLKKVENAKEGRDSVEIAIFGMSGVPKELVDARRAREAAGEKKQKKEQESSDDEGDESSSEEEEAAAPAPPPPPVPQYPQPPQQPQFAPPPGYGAPFGHPPHGYNPHQPQQMMYPGMRPPMPGQPFNPMMGGMGGYPQQMRPPMQGMPGMPPFPHMQPMQPPPPPPAEPRHAQVPAQPKGPVEGVESDKKGTTKVLFIFKDVMSMEERRAQLPKYRV